MIQQNDLVVHVDQGEDFAAQFYWRDQYGSPIEFTDPVAAVVIDSVGNKVLQFGTAAASNDEDYSLTNPCVYITPELGLFQLTIPSVVTRGLTPGTYRFDLFANATGKGTAYRSPQQYKKVVKGSMVVSSRITRLEEVEG